MQRWTRLAPGWNKHGHPSFGWSLLNEFWRFLFAAAVGAGLATTYSARSGALWASGIYALLVAWARWRDGLDAHNVKHGAAPIAPVPEPRHQEPVIPHNWPSSDPY